MSTVAAKRAGAMPLDPITLEVVRNKLNGIANEMQSTLLRSSFSTVVKEGRDASASLFTADGETLAQAIAIPIHLATLIPIVQTMIAIHHSTTHLWAGQTGVILLQAHAGADTNGCC